MAHKSERAALRAPPPRGGMKVIRVLQALKHAGREIRNTPSPEPASCRRSAGRS
jgi:hypothetical protein